MNTICGSATIPPAWSRIISRATACVRKNGPRRLVSRTRSQLSGVVSSRSSRRSGAIPALLTQRSIRPANVDGLLDQAAALGQIGDVGPDRDGAGEPRALGLAAGLLGRRRHPSDNSRRPHGRARPAPGRSRARSPGLPPVTTATSASRPSIRSLRRHPEAGERRDFAESRHRTGHMVERLTYPVGNTRLLDSHTTPTTACNPRDRWQES